MTAVRKLRPEILLHPNIPKALHGMAPRVIYGQEWWDKTRRAAYESTKYHCVACGVSRFLAIECKHMEAHELYEYSLVVRRGRLMGRLVYEEAVPLCHYCHNYIHSGRMAALVDKREMSEQKRDSVIVHGERILREANLMEELVDYRHTNEILDVTVEWGNWRMVVDGKEYGPNWKSFEEWDEYYSNLRAEVR